MSWKSKVAVVAAGLTAFGGIGAVAATTAGASTQTCNGCYHIQNDYAFRGALDALHQATAVNSPVGLWYEKPSTTDPGADFQVVNAGVVGNSGKVNQSGLNWKLYKGDEVVRFKYSPYGNGGANTYLGLEGPAAATATKLALRADNPNSVWQEWIVAPVSPTTNEPIASVADFNLQTYTGHYALIDVGQTVNPDDPMLATDPGDALTGSLTQLDVEVANFNQGNALPTNQIWDTQN